MLNRYRKQFLITFTADVFMCQHCTTGGNIGYWNLRLLREGTLIDAFHWDKDGWPIVDYKENDEVLVGGRWTTKAKSCFQVIQSSVVTRAAANDPEYETHPQLDA